MGHEEYTFHFIISALKYVVYILAMISLCALYSSVGNVSESTETKTLPAWFAKQKVNKRRDRAI